MSPMFRRLALLLPGSILLGAVTGHAADAGADETFVGSVSQGGRYEVEASSLALRRVSAADVKDVAATEVHDHELVNAKLRRIADAAGIRIAPGLNAQFQQRLAALRAVSTADFDKAYLDDMKDIHDKDEKLFAREAVDGTGAFKPFAHQTDLIVKRHIGALHGND